MNTFLIMMLCFLIGLFIIWISLVVSSRTKKKLLKKAQSLVLKNRKKRENALSDIVDLLSEEEYFSLITRDMAFYRFVVYYPFHLNSDLPAFIPQQAGLDKISEYEFKSLISSQNSLLREKASLYIEEFSYLRKFLIGIIEREKEEFLLERYLKSITFYIPDEILVDKITSISSRVLLGLLFQMLLSQGFDFNILKEKIETVEDSFVKEFCGWILDPHNNISRLVMEMAQEESDEMFTFLSTFLTSLEDVDIETIETVISLTENRRFSGTFDIANKIQTIDNIKVFYSIIDNFDKMDELSRVYMINRAFFYFRNIKLCSQLIEKMSDFKDRRYEILLTDIALNSNEKYLVRVSLQALIRLNSMLTVNQVRSLYRRWDEEILYYAVVFLLTDNGKSADKLLKKIYNRSTVFIRKRIKKLSTKL
ncbi:MAG: hypothetical protein C0601_13245 [Candidatus Muiribacterium halophilum]|uniref:Uncharacterized protein n=1 Tax=Muiribacterium halophilum TaxID=2053465 RepID=A0A2N5Z9I4_MUIH1|nr:MAG: hypothetical protein C0601_13245 [Candidatus Muirbacterium halophilum]